MNKYKDDYLILLAGGTGSRMKCHTSKQLIKINGETLIEKCIKSFIKIIKNKNIIIVTNDEDLKPIKLITKKYKLLSPILGECTRQKSVYNGLVAIKRFSPKYVLIHDTARPLISTKIIRTLIDYKNKNNISCVVPIIPVNDALRVVKKNILVKTIVKKNKYLAQTPQLCDYNTLLSLIKNSKINYEDESSAFMDNDIDVLSINGDPLSLKVTYPEDLKLLKPHLLDTKNYITKIGNGFDIHRFDIPKNKIKNYIMLGGVKILNTRPLIGHSDADVLLHAVTDSILGIVNKGDIGKMFPPTSQKWKNADSEVFLKQASLLLKKEGGKINNIDAVIICEEPKILNYSQKMQEKIGKILKINSKRICIKGKSSESIGFIGRKEGIAVTVSTSVQIIENIFDDQLQ